MIPLIVRFFARLREVSPFFSSNRRQETPLSVEQLEPRILYSAAPVEAPVAEEAPVAAQEAPAAAPTPAPAVAASLEAAAPIEGGQGVGDISESQNVALVEVGGASSELNQQTVEALAAEARQRWIDSGISAEQIAALDSVSYDIADVGGAHLGVANGFSITIDDDAGGTGVGNWFVDSTPDDDAEFGENVSAAASGRFDLLSTLIHEQGHVLGLGDIFGARTNVMDGFLDAGTRRLPVDGQAEGGVVGAMSGDHFLTAHIARASTDAMGGESDGHSFDPAISANGRYVVFDSVATNLVSGDGNGLRDVFRKDLVTGEIVRVSTNSNGLEGIGGDSTDASISADGRYVVFRSSATNLVTGDTNGTTDIFLKDLQTGAVTLVSADSTGAQVSGFSSGASISANGRYVAFHSSSGSLVAGDSNLQTDIFVKDVKTGKITRVNTDATGAQAVGGGSMDAKISADGRHVAFGSDATNLVAGDSNGQNDIFIKNLNTGAITRVNTDSSGTQSANSASAASISADGKRVAFHSAATDLVAGDTNSQTDIFVKDLATGETIRVNTTAADGEATGGISLSPAISADGRFVAFTSTAGNLVAGDTNGGGDIFFKEIATGAISRVSTNVDGNQVTPFNVGDAAISADNGYVAFVSASANLVSNDSNALRDVFVKGVASLTQSYTTSVETDSSGNLYIDDIGGDDTADNLFIGIVNGLLEISDKNATVGTSIVGATTIGTAGRAIRIPLNSFTGDIIVRTGNGDDIITLGDLSGLSGGVIVEETDGHDIIKQTGVITLTGGAELEYAAEEIRLVSGSSITVDTGEISLLGNFNQTSMKRSVGVFATGSSLTTNGSGAITIHGTGGVAGSGNRGVDLRNTDIFTGGGELDITGLGGMGVSSNEGVRIGRGSVFTVSGFGDLTLQGTGGGTGNANRGVFVQSGVLVEVGGGGLVVFGTGAAGQSGNAGVVIQNAQLSNGGISTLQVFGTGKGSGSGNVGATISGATLKSSGGAQVSLFGLGSFTSSGSGNRGLDMNLATVNAAGGGNVSVSGSGGTGSSSNSAVRAVNTNVMSASGSVSFSGTAASSATNNANRGVNFSGGSISAATSLTLTANGGGGVNNNEALRLISADLTAGTTLNVTGSASTMTTGSSNRGIFARNLDLEGSSVTVTGNAGEGLSRNEGLRFLGGSVVSTTTHVLLAGNGSSSTTGSGNRGAFFHKVDVDANTNATLRGFAGGGVNSNSSLYVNASSVVANNGNVSLPGAAFGTTTGRNNYGALIKNTTVTAASAVNVAGAAGEGTDGNNGLTIAGGSFEAQGTTLSVIGSADSDASGSGNFGVKISNATFTGVDTTSINGTGGGGVDGNYGVQVQGVTVTSQGSGASIQGVTAGNATGNGNFGILLTSTHVSGQNTFVSGTGSTGSNGNYGLQFRNGSVTSTTGSATVSGTANSSTTGSGNNGATLRNVVIHSDSGSTVSVNGSGGGGVSKNHGVQIDGGSVSNDLNDVTVIGNGDVTTTGAANFGLRISKVTASAGDGLSLIGNAGSGTNGNFGAFITSVTATSGDEVFVSGFARSTTTGSNNYGLYLNKSSVSGTNLLDISGTGGGGVNRNWGTRVLGGTMESANQTDIDGTANAGTTGIANSGVYIFNGVTLIGTNLLQIGGTGGGGTASNFGVFMNNNITAAGAMVNGNATDGVSDDEAGDFF